jgi:hypothetical protein
VGRGRRVLGCGGGEAEVSVSFKKPNDRSVFSTKDKKREREL